MEDSHQNAKSEDLLFSLSQYIAINVKLVQFESIPFCSGSTRSTPESKRFPKIQTDVSLGVFLSKFTCAIDFQIDVMVIEAVAALLWSHALHVKFIL